ncbi:hypothetical protein BDZ91DRAFT_741762 [Kalaharituber pfeilii]|nr:hypothetical protein BDZ91DRAFT_741762 [Kalaharituber pfeilii]
MPHIALLISLPLDIVIQHLLPHFTPYTILTLRLVSRSHYLLSSDTTICHTALRLFYPHLYPSANPRVAFDAAVLRGQRFSHGLPVAWDAAEVNGFARDVLIGKTDPGEAMMVSNKDHRWLELKRLDRNWDAPGAQNVYVIDMLHEVDEWLSMHPGQTREYHDPLAVAGVGIPQGTRALLAMQDKRVLLALVLRTRTGGFPARPIYRDFYAVVNISASCPTGRRIIHLWQSQDDRAPAPITMKRGPHGAVNTHYAIYEHLVMNANAEQPVSIGTRRVFEIAIVPLPPYRGPHQRVDTWFSRRAFEEQGAGPVAADRAGKLFFLMSCPSNLVEGGHTIDNERYFGPGTWVDIYKVVLSETEDLGCSSPQRIKRIPLYGLQSTSIQRCLLPGLNLANIRGPFTGAACAWHSPPQILSRSTAKEFVTLTLSGTVLSCTDPQHGTQIGASYTFPVEQTRLDQFLPKSAEQSGGCWALVDIGGKWVWALRPDAYGGGARGWVFNPPDTIGGFTYTLPTRISPSSKIALARPLEPLCTRGSRELCQHSSAYWPPKPLPLDHASPTNWVAAPGPALNPSPAIYELSWLIVRKLQIPLWRWEPCDQTRLGGVNFHEETPLQQSWYVELEVGFKGHAPQPGAVVRTHKGRKLPPGGFGVTVISVGDGWVVYEIVRPKKVVVVWFGK